MADWEDDDFGGFESADIGDVGLAQTGIPSPGGPPSVTNQQNDGSSTQILDWILSNTSKADTSDTTPKIITGGPTEVPSLSLDADLKDQESPLDSPASISHGEQLKNRLNDSAEIAKSLDDSYSSPADQDTNASEPIWSAEFKETQAKIREAAAEEPPKADTVNSEVLHKLQAELDATLLMKEQTEKSMAKLEEELRNLAERQKQDLEDTAKQHEEELKKLKLQHKEEMEELQKISEETVKVVTKQYADMWVIFEKEKAAEAEANANSMMEKCLELMKQQKELLSKKLEENRLEQENNLKESLRGERERMETDIADKLEQGRKNVEEELTAQIREKLSEEAKKLQELHTETLKNAMTKQQEHFEKALESTLSDERERFAETLKNAVKNAQVVTEKAAEERRKIEESRMRSHTLSVKMFLTSALKQLEQQFPDDEVQQSESKES